ncbi:MAG: hypothetical protein LH473_05240, partial [Chitinophagales bacterium]|nr:hypothetical protein [Chitinophagales bacterium]
ALAVIEISTVTECCGELCNQKGADTAPETSQTSNDCGGVCNPLMTCGNCIGFTFSCASFAHAPLSLVAVKSTVFTLVASSIITIPIWQPPKIS